MVLQNHDFLPIDVLGIVTFIANNGVEFCDEIPIGQFCIVVFCSRISKIKFAIKVTIPIRMLPITSFRFVFVRIIVVKFV
jgi:hypothetical protein